MNCDTSATAPDRIQGTVSGNRTTEDEDLPTTATMERKEVLFANATQINNHSFFHGTLRSSSGTMKENNNLVMAEFTFYFLYCYYFALKLFVGEEEEESPRPELFSWKFVGILLPSQTVWRHLRRPGSLLMNGRGVKMNCVGEESFVPKGFDSVSVFKWNLEILFCRNSPKIGDNYE